MTFRESLQRPPVDQTSGGTSVCQEFWCPPPYGLLNQYVFGQKVAAIHQISLRARTMGALVRHITEPLTREA